MHEYLLLQETERQIYASDILLAVALLTVAIIFTAILIRWRVGVPIDSAPQFYRYDLQIRHCPFCEQPIAGAGAQICTNCGHSLVIENM